MDEAISAIMTTLYKHQPLTSKQLAEHVPETDDAIAALEMLLDRGWVVEYDGMFRLAPEAEEPAATIIMSNIFARSTNSAEDAERAGLMVTEAEFNAKGPDNLPFAFMVNRGDRLDVWCAGRLYATIRLDGTVEKH